MLWQKEGGLILAQDREKIPSFEDRPVPSQTLVLSKTEHSFSCYNPRPILTTNSSCDPYRLALTKPLSFKDANWHFITVNPEQPGTSTQLWQDCHSTYVILGDTKHTPGNYHSSGSHIIRPKAVCHLAPLYSPTHVPTQRPNNSTSHNDQLRAISDDQQLKENMMVSASAANS